MSDAQPEAIIETEVLGSFDANNVLPVRHNFIDRGLKYTCESAGHPYHEVWKVGKVSM
jgi:hypothetical protein